MNTTKKLIVIVTVAVLAVISVIPATFSWYSHSSNPVNEGNRINFADSTLPVSLKTAGDPSTISMKTYAVDKNGDEESSNVVSDFSVDAHSTQHYKTVFTNTGNDSVMVDLNIAGLGNNSDYYVGTTSPTLNEKCYASRASRTKATGETFRVYFKSNRKFYPYWTKYVSASVDYSNLSNLSNDMNVAYKLTTNPDVQYMKLTICNNYSGNTSTLESNNNQNAVQSAIDSTVFYADIPTNIEYFFFFNHYYRPDDKNKNWNSTINITDFSQGKLYRMIGEMDGDEYKIYEAGETDQSLVALNQYYSDVRLSLGSNVTADIGLKKTGDDEEFVPDYFGQDISYSIDNRDGTDTNGLITVSRDGLIIPAENLEPSDSIRTSRVKTKITGRYGDYKEVYTIVSIPPSIAEVPIMKNIIVRAPGSTTPEGSDGDKIEVYWYIKNKSGSQMTVDSVFFTI